MEVIPRYDAEKYQHGAERQIDQSDDKGRTE